MRYPLVSVIIPTYKRTDYLKLTLQSVLNQTFKDFEIIVVDDGTPNDENFFLCQTFDKVRYIKIENSGGPAKPRNVGIREAKGKYIAFVDDDDLWLPYKLEKQVTVLENNPDFGLVHCCCEVIDEDGIAGNTIVGRPGTPEVKHGDVLMRMMGNWTVMMSTPLVRIQIIKNIGFFNEKMPSAGEDTEFWTRCSFETKFYYLDEPLVQYRIHSHNLSEDKFKYLELPKYLKKIVIDKYNSGKIDKKEFDILLNFICQYQLKMAKVNLLITLKNVFKLDLYWMFKANNLKLLAYILFFKK
ncbi:glycosyltransferase family 2 protein [Flavobacterium marginilacus]|uniref:glycosyltransferase family 2 protein n=1 Tax=Flavobacterium marginilacus TaxID=3003256 RepID=UPI00248D4AAC|nr:glycosyltransferase family A protein [Flavobacterium marginilacus]